MKVPKRVRRMKGKAALPSIASRPSVAAKPQDNELAGIRSAGHRTFVTQLSQLSGFADDPETLAVVGAIIGQANAADDRNAGSLRMNELLSTNMTRRVLNERANNAMQFDHIRVHVPGSRVPWEDGQLDLTRSYEFTRLVKPVASHSFWAMVPGIMLVNADVMAEFALEGILFDEQLNEHIEDRVAELRYRLTRANGGESLTVTHLDRDERMITRKIRSMFCVSPTHLPPLSGDTEQDARYAHRLLQIRAMMEVKQMTKFDTGEGKAHMYAALNATKKYLPDRASARLSGAPKARRARDIARLQRMTGFGDFELPYIKR
jgi:hypothetical protein